ncbi:MAG: glycosyl hydrolase [Tenericutes bacterium HGW-Tenericutes-1]|jgi:exo-beta-1,3-glucanase (GH17 family)|nr:MAG: glycosyl hydrolase [Tenericutes bacterium HGW-Tenericutes-1]
MSSKTKTKFLLVDRSKLDLSKTSKDPMVELKQKIKSLLNDKIYGISFSPYTDNQNPGQFDWISPEQIESRLSIVKPYVHWIRTFSCTLGNEAIAPIAKSHGLKTLVGAWIGENLEMNEAELDNIIRIAKDGHADMVAIGNEVLLREDIPLELMISYLKRFKEAVPNVPVGYVDAYYTFVNEPELIEVCDVIFANCYPFWERCNFSYAVSYMKEMYAFVKKAAKDKEVIISETGWPTKGESYGEALPSFENAARYFIETYEWAKANHINVFYFSSFDESWKSDEEGEYGAYWGLWDNKGNYKF